MEHSVNHMWIIVSAILVMFMQAGFAMVEAGFTRAKNAGNIVMKNFMDFAVGALVYWAIGWSIAYGPSDFYGLFATGDYFFSNSANAHLWFFQVVFAATATTIVSGAVAERVKFSAYLIYTPFIVGIIYPVISHWVWDPHGWLNKLGFVDFAGSGVVHLTGGIAALVGAAIVGPRIGKYDEKGIPRNIPGHSLTLGALGVFILWFGWYGFNGGSTLEMNSQVASIMVTTTLAPAAGALVAMLVSWIVDSKPDVGMTLNGALAGLVGITAGANSISFGYSVLVGGIAGALIVGSIKIFEKFGLDDPVGAVSVHGIGGIWGVIAVGLFGGGKLFIQLIGITSIVAWTLISCICVFKLIDKIIVIRIPHDQELRGLDMEEHGAEAYPEFINP